MSIIPFGNLPDRARLWIYGCSESIPGDELDGVRSDIDEFVDRWTSHGRATAAGWDLRYSLFFLIAADEVAQEMSGCAIDSLVHTLLGVERKLGIDIVNCNAGVFFRDSGGDIRYVSRETFRRLAGVSGDTIVFDNTITTLAELREEKWELPLMHSWHGRVFTAVHVADS